MKKLLVSLLFCLSTLSFSAVCSSEIIVEGSQPRVEMVKRFYATKGIVSKTIITSSEVMGELNRKPWPGVRVSTTPNSNDGVFVPLSDQTFTTGLCVDQKNLLDNIISKISRENLLSEKSESFFLLCEGGEPAFPISIKTSTEELILNFAGQKEVVMFWLEDSLGKRVFSPKGFALDDGRYRQWFVPRLDCNPEAYIKWWDRDSSGQYWLSDRINRNRNEISIFVPEQPRISPVVVYWQVRPSGENYFRGKIQQVKYNEDEGFITGKIVGSKKSFFSSKTEVPLSRVVHLFDKENILVGRAISDKKGDFKIPVSSESDRYKILCLYPLERKDDDGNYYSIFFEEGEGVEDTFILNTP